MISSVLTKLSIETLHHLQSRADLGHGSLNILRRTGDWGLTMSYYEPSSLYALQEEKNYLDSLGDGDSGVENDWWGLFKTCQVRRLREERGVVTGRNRPRLSRLGRNNADSIFSPGL